MWIYRRAVARKPNRALTAVRSYALFTLFESPETNNNKMNAYKINDCDIYAAHTMSGAILDYTEETGNEWVGGEDTAETMSPEDPWRDEETPDVEETIADVLARTTKPGFIGTIG